MRITYEWTEREWAQAVGVATRKASRGAPLPGMVYALVGIPLLGAVGDLASLMGHSGRITLAGSLVPLLLVMFATAAALINMSRARRRRLVEGVSPMPDGTREMVLQESGWRFNALDPRGSHAGITAMSASAAISGPASTSPVSVLSGALPRVNTPMLRSWSELVEARQGSGVIVLVHRDGFEAVPSKWLTPEQAGHLHRLVMRKMRPAP